MKTFKLTEKDQSGTSLKGNIRGVKFEDLVQAFGEPNCDGDGYKVPFEWILESSDGEVVTVYPWKNTVLYDPSLPSVENMKKENTVWNVGAKSSYAAMEFYLEFEKWRINK